MNIESALVNERINALRPRLLNVTRRNPLINNVLSGRNRSYISIVDEKPQSVLNALKDDAMLQVAPLPIIGEDNLPDEQTQEFKTAFANAVLVDERHRTVIDAIDFENDERAFEKQALQERALKDQIRIKLELPPRPDGTQHSDLVNQAKILGINPSKVLPAANFQATDDRHEDNELQTLLLPETLQARMSTMLSKQRIFEEERGLRVSYLVIGYLQWKVQSSDPKDGDLKSPLILIPISFARERSADGEIYTISQIDDPQINPVLRHKLEVDLGLDLSELLDQINSDHLDVESLFNAVQAFQPNVASTWQVKREATLGLYPFPGIDLHNDLRGEDIDFSSFSVLKELMLGKGPADGTASDWSNVELDSEESQAKVPHLVADADSSQHLALMRVASGENVALEGPPGSGKSQTIVNAIANALHEGKRVLFVAQKQTALEVVNARLQALGLDKFVLPMVGAKSDTEGFYEALEQRLAVKKTRTPQQISALRQKLGVQRSAISRYIDLLNSSVGGTQLSMHEVLGLSMQYHEAINNLPLSLRTVEPSFHKFSAQFDLSDLRSLLKELNRWSTELSEYQLGASSPWANASTSEIDYDALVGFKTKGTKASEELATELSTLDSSLQRIVSPILDSHNHEDVAEALDWLSRWKSSDDSNWHALAMRAESSQPRLVELSALQDEAEKMVRASSLSEDALLDAGHSVTELRSISRFLELCQIDRLDENGVQQAIMANETRLDQLEEIKDQLDRLNSSGNVVEPHRFLQARSAIADLKAEQWLVDLLATHTIDQAVLEMEQANKGLANAYQVLDEGQPIPLLKQVKVVNDTIKHTGFFGRFGRRYKDALAQAAAWLGQSKISAREKVAAVASLEQLAEEIQDLDKLTVTELLPSIEYASRSKLRTSQTLLKDTLLHAKVCGVSAEHLFTFVCDPAVDTVCDFLEAESRSDRSWSFLDKEISATAERLQFAETNRELLAIGERFCLQHSITDGDTLKGIAQSGECYLKICALQENAGRELGLEPCLPTRQAVTDYANFCSRFISYCAELKSLLVDSNQQSALEAVTGLLPFVAEVEASVTLLDRGKGLDTGQEPVAASLASIKSHLGDETGFNNLVQRRNTLLSAERVGLGPLLSLLERENLLDEADSSGAAAVMHCLKVRAESEYGSDLLLHSGTTLDGARLQLQEIDRELIALAPAAVSAAVVDRSNPPVGIGRGRKSEYTELSLLQHELGKKRRTPPRKLLKRARESLTDLFPCWMMVPGAVAQHLPREECFDLVIIDEASQMTPENSVSALMRASQALVSGDTNQLPPTDFFKSLSIDEDLDEDISTDEESILELANTQFHPKHRLNWHYRSRHEDLIAFSNYHVYDSDLTIFPSPNHSGSDLGVSMIQVKGTFQRGLNLVEAEVMVERIARFMKTNPDRSLGVVTMNQSQAEQVDSMVMREAQCDPAVAEYIDRWAEKNSGLEKFFVKNLENVQGDERDVIFIGTVYGADAQGKFYQRFGPINGASGKRRLNVLFTRAKEQIVTFSSIPLEAFNPSSSNTGATLLKAWLQFSSSGRLGGGAVNDGSCGAPDSPFEEHVIAAIESLGFQAVPQVGASGYFIDIGVKHPDYPVGFLCGVECDGATYHSAKSARDRDRLRQEVLERLGWDLYRIWSTDWFRDPYGQTQVLKRYLEALLATKCQSAKASEGNNVVDFLPSSQQSLYRDEALESQRAGNNDEDDLAAAEEPVRTDDPVEIGSRVSIRYLNGPRAGISANFWLTDRKETESFRMPGSITLRADSPLGEAVYRSYPGDVVTYKLADEEVRVELIDTELPETRVAAG